MGRTIEFPRGSGQVAEYTDEEVEQIRPLLEHGPQVEPLLRLIHELKTTVDAQLVPNPVPPGVCPECETGAGLHTEDCSVAEMLAGA